ncbi:hypothetical protein AB0D13_40535 [Streptomyces sp. NPDC048430]|uniref:hypothetical protein n=1 Tax=Streptomyces sp. NPDC048430 TaxID=3155388 RepID=UPI00342B5F7D
MFNRVGERNPDLVVPRLQELTRYLWAGERQRGDYHLYDEKIPIIATGLNNLGEHGPTGPVFLRFGRDHMQPLLDAIGNPRREAADAREQEEYRLQREERKAQAQHAEEQKAAEREAGRPACTQCGAKFTDDRWTAAETYPGPGPGWYSNLCGLCEKHTVEAEQQAEAKRQEQDQVPEQKSSGWFSRLRT